MQQELLFLLHRWLCSKAGRIYCLLILNDQSCNFPNLRSAIPNNLTIIRFLNILQPVTFFPSVRKSTHIHKHIKMIPSSISLQIKVEVLFPLKYYTLHTLMSPYKSVGQERLFLTGNIILLVIIILIWPNKAYVR